MERTFNNTETGYTYGYPMNSIPVNSSYSLPNYNYPYNFYQLVWRIPQKKGIVRFRATDTNGQLLFYDYEWDYNISPNAESEIMRLECGYSSMKDLFPTMDVNKPYTIQQIVSGHILGTYTFTPQTCNGNDLIQVKFLNKWGIWDYLYFTGRETISESVTSETYKYNKINYATMKYELADATYHKFNTQGKGKTILNSGFVEEAKNEKFKELLLSEFVLIEDENDGLLPYIITDKELTFKTTKWDKLINYTITLENGFDTINKII